jgi:terminase small subunit-like protein
MASQPFKRAFEVQVRQRGGWEAILDRIKTGETITNIAKDYGCSRPWLARMLNKPGRREALAAAKKEAGEAHAEKATEIADTVPESRDAVAKARLQVETHRWMAASRDREQFGDVVPDVNVTMNFAQLHLDALRHRIVPADRPPDNGGTLPPPYGSDGDEGGDVLATPVTP